MINILLTSLPEIMTILFGIIVLLQIIYYVALFFRFSFHKPKQLEPNNFPVSIVIVAKNDAHLLIKTLPEWLNQDYQKFEVVVVNDNSNDETPQLIRDFQTRFPHVKLLHLESSVTNIKGKKFPLSLGIKAATYEHVLLTDADCLPASNQWLKLMARHFNKTTKIVLGYSNIPKKVGFLNTFIRFDKLHQAIQYFSYCLSKIPFMGAGQNLAYTKTLFFNVNGFASHNHLHAGEDDLFINSVANQTHFAIEYEHEAHTISTSTSVYYHWFLFKIFRVKTRKRYAKSRRFLLNFYNFLMTFSYILLGFAIYFSLGTPACLYSVLSFMLLKFIIQYICFGFAAGKLNEKGLIPYILFFDVIFAALNPVIHIASKFKK